MKVRWLRGATRSLRAAHRGVAADKPKAAAKAAARVEIAVERFARRPAMGRTGRRPGTREIVAPGTPYVVIYRIGDGEIQILRVYLASRNWHGLA